MFHRSGLLERCNLPGTPEIGLGSPGPQGFASVQRILGVGLALHAQEMGHIMLERY